jgi:hypothetical protein
MVEGDGDLVLDEQQAGDADGPGRVVAHGTILAPGTHTILSRLFSVAAFEPILPHVAPVAER